MTKEVKLWLSNVRKLLRAHGMVISITNGEYRVNYVGGKESTAYYTDSIEDAFSTALLMGKADIERNRQLHEQRVLRGY
jgi:hypothetical protein